ncbi:hypothetical protein DIS24_g7888 [Lasiodiplodia hormozganensis]|uniref:Transcriptional regulator n=1 Tax=Lasiodiplodia hormozganensis TaxID=869390 RepID=A0AA40CQE2_9PEZI|nr:hypothetical protein DIS24_g7888 [Lasiodiplodia hormozganensis]
MFLPAIHAENDLPTLHAFIRANPLGLLTTAIHSPTQAFPVLQASHLPFVLDVPDSDDSSPSSSSDKPLGILRAHMARANPQVKAMTETMQPAGGQPQTLEQDVLILFNGPSQHYVTPKFYTATKPVTGKVVPTWNYSAVQVYGKLKLYLDAKSDATQAFLDKQMADLSRMCETSIMGFARPWEVDDAPEAFVNMKKKAIVGIEVEITSVAGKWKMSQEMGEGDRKGVAEGFEGIGNEDMAAVVREREDLMLRKKMAAAS